MNPTVLTLAIIGGLTVAGAVVLTGVVLYEKIKEAIARFKASKGD